MKLANWGKIAGFCIVFAAMGAIAADLGIKFKTGTDSFRYKMTVEVETPEGVKTGSAVREVTVKFIEPEIQGLYETQARVSGEAVVVDLGKRGVLFALMGTDDYRTVFNALPIPGKFPRHGGLTPEGFKYYSHLKNAKAVLSFDQYPRMVRFRDLKDPKSIEAVYILENYEQPQGAGSITRTRIKENNFEEMFGKGVSIKSVTIEITNEPITKRIEKVIPSFGDGTGFKEWQMTLNYGDPLSLDRSNFVYELKND